MNRNLTVPVLGSKIKERRKEQGLTQLQLAMFSGVGLRFLRELEHGKESLHIGKVLQVVDMLGLTLTIGER
jgi:HTH-type transcriptional regulator/antitoxin HipB